MPTQKPPSTRRRRRGRSGSATSQRTRDTEAALIEHATTLFAERGYNGTSITDLAEALGLVNASVYYYVDSKQELLLRVLQAAMEGFLTRLVEINESDASSRDKVRLAIENHLSFVLNRSQAVAVFLRERRFLEPPFTEQYDDAIGRYDELFVELLEEGTASGEFPPVDARITARLILGAINWIVEWYDMSGPLSQEDLTAEVVELVMERMLAHP